MEKVSVVLIDDEDDFRWVLRIFLTMNGLLVSGSFTHHQFLKQPKPKTDIDIIIISFDTPQFLTELNIAFVREYSTAVKILVNSNFDDRKAIDKVIKMNVDGLVFKTNQDPEHILKAIQVLKANGNFFDAIL
jgi:DNA-binding NarL/FixJ family response regulator